MDVTRVSQSQDDEGTNLTATFRPTLERPLLL
jgi:hypothetical protein